MVRRNVGGEAGGWSETEETGNCSSHLVRWLSTRGSRERAKRFSYIYSMYDAEDVVKEQRERRQQSLESGESGGVAVGCVKKATRRGLVVELRKRESWEEQKEGRELCGIGSRKIRLHGMEGSNVPRYGR